jgi:hypothetical protein
MQRRRIPYLSVFLKILIPGQLALAQNLFGSGVGIVTKKVLKCSSKQRGVTAKTMAHHQMTYVNTMNIIPFEDISEENVRRGMQIKYIPRTMELTVTVKYRVLHGREKIEPELDARNLADRLWPQNLEFDDYYPLFSNTTVFSSSIRQINLREQTVLLSNNQHC